MTPEQQENWIEKTITAVGGAAVLSQASSREVARHALTALFRMTNNDSAASLAMVQKISNFPVRRRLMEVFRRSFVEVSAPFTSPIFFQQGSFSNVDFADAFDSDLLLLWRKAEQDRTRFNALIEAYPNAARIRIIKRLTSTEFARKRRIRHAVKGVFSRPDGASNAFISFLALLIFLTLLVTAFD